MSLSSTFGAPYILVRSDKSELSVPLLTMDQIAEVAAVIEKRRKERLIRNAREQELNKLETARFVQDGEQQEIEIADVRAFSSTLMGTNKILPMVLSADDVAGLDPDQRQEASMGAVGFIIRKKTDGKQAQNPSTGGAPSGGNATAV